MVFESRITPHPTYQQPGVADAARHEAYRRLFAAGDDPSGTEALRQHTPHRKCWGSERFRKQIEALTQRAAGVRSRGRPRSTDK